MLPRLLLPLALWAGMAQASFDVTTPIPPGKCMVIIASRPTLETAGRYIDGLSPSPPYAQVFPSSSGWYAVSIGSLWLAERAEIMASWKASGRIPQDAFCTTGERFAPPVDWRVAAQTPPPGTPYLTPDGRHLRTDNANGTYTLRDLRTAQLRSYNADGTPQQIMFAQVGFASLPPLTPRYQGWSTALEDQVAALAADIIRPGDPVDFEAIGAESNEFDRLILRLIVLELLMEERP